MKNKAAAIADQLDRIKADAKEANTALRLQVRAWRICAIISTVDPKRGAEVAKWLFFVSVPFVDANAVQAFVDAEEKNCERYGEESGIFAHPTERRRAKAEAKRRDAR